MARILSTQAALGAISLLAAVPAGAQAPPPAAAAFQTTIGTLNPVAVVFFILFALSTLGITYWAAKRTRTTKEFYAAGCSVTANRCQWSYASLAYRTAYFPSPW